MLNGFGEVKRLEIFRPPERKFYLNIGDSHFHRQYIETLLDSESEDSYEIMEDLWEANEQMEKTKAEKENIRLKRSRKIGTISFHD